MIYIRKGVFETNSSSSHSIVMTKTDKPIQTDLPGNMVDPNWHVNDDGIMDFWYDEDLDFGRTPFDLLTDWFGRLKYCIAYYGNNEDKFKEIEEACYKRVAGFKGFKFRTDRWDKTEYRGYVDHQSYGVLDAALRKFDVSIEDFIFNDRFIIVIDGDEYGVFNTLTDTDLFNKNSVEKIVSADEYLEDEYFNKEKE